ncbi:MAG: enoyl-CoA hydratase/isomerase family protein [Acidimicrobiia bacterium]|nr:enoyl-CoA hydratase/isomerase family protein [Acidimicrobiia bacterium]
MTFDLTRQGDVFVLTMDAADNRFNKDSLERINHLLDTVEGHDGPAALVTTGTGKFYSNGLDLEWIMSGEAEWDLGKLAHNLHALLARTLLFSRPTVAAINGHCFAAGAMWSLAHDVRIMREDRGYWSLPEADIRIPFTPGMAALIQSKLTKQTAHLAMVTARRFGGTEAAGRGIVDESAPEGEVLTRAIAVAQELAAKDPATMSAIKATMYGPVEAHLSG